MGGFCLLENTFLWAFVCFFSLGFSPSLYWFFLLMNVLYPIENVQMGGI